MITTFPKYFIAWGIFIKEYKKIAIFSKMRIWKLHIFNNSLRIKYGIDRKCIEKERRNWCWKSVYKANTIKNDLINNNNIQNIYK